MSSAQDVDWDELRRAAVEAATRAYAPYSGLHVGAAAVASSHWPAARAPVSC